MFDRIKKLIRGFFSRFLSNVENANPQVLLEAEADSLREAIASYNMNLAKQAALVEKIRTQADRLRKVVEKNTSRITALFQTNKEEAGRIALTVKSQKSELADLEGQMAQADELYKNLTRQRDVYVREAQKRIESIKQKMNRAELAESQAQLAEIATATAFDMAGSGATLQRLEENLDDRVAQAAGKIRVAADNAASGDWTVKAEEEAALEAQALAEFATAMNLQSESPSATRMLPEDMIRDLGPGQTN